jgi:8-oxo-dGTP pyrophosphatase MutT (NUDIX family)
MDPNPLPSTFYRVSIKALVFDDRNRLLVGLTKDEEAPGWEIPGGGWEHDETFEQ